VLQCLGMLLTSCGLLSGYLMSVGSKDQGKIYDNEGQEENLRS
jgi:hypothetical protein